MPREIQLALGLILIAFFAASFSPGRTPSGGDAVAVAFSAGPGLRLVPPTEVGVGRMSSEPAMSCDHVLRVSAVSVGVQCRRLAAVGL